MSKNHKKGKHSQSNNRSKLTTRMEVEFGSEKPSIFPPNLIIAASKLKRVLVLGS